MEKEDQKTKDVKEEKKHMSKKRVSEEYIEQIMAKRRKVIKISIIVVVIIVLLLICSTAFALTAMFSNKIISGVTIDGVDVSGLNKTEATQLIEEKMNSKKDGMITLKYQDYEKELSLTQLEVTANVEEAINKACDQGRSNNIFINNINVIKSKFVKQNIDMNITYNEEELDKVLTETSAELPGVVQEYSYSIEGNELIVTPGKDGIVLDKDEMLSEISSEIKELSKSITTEREIAVKNEKASAIDVEKIYNEVHSDPQDAYIIEDPFQVVVDKEGIDFAITMDEAKALFTELKDEYVIPLKITKANVTVSSLGSRAFPDELSVFTTRYDAGNVSRTTNLSIACSKLNGYVIQPGEVFSYNKVLGKRSVENGYREAAIYTSNGVENGLGGGICQISSTLYNAVLMANLGIEERHNHSYTTSYSDPGRDATVAYGSLDFKFKNTRKYPVKIEAYIKSGVATIRIYGIKENPDYKVQVVAKVTSTIPCDVQRIEDPTLPAGTEKVVTKGTNGCRSVTYKNVYDQSGNLVSSTQISSDYYKTITRVVKVGTKQTAIPTPTPSVEPTPTPSPEPEPSETPTEPVESPDPSPSTEIGE